MNLNYDTPDYKKNTTLFLSVLLVSLLPIFFKELHIHEAFSSIPCTIATTVILFFCYIVNQKKLLTRQFILWLLLNAVSLVIPVMHGGALGVATVHVNTFLLVHLLNNTLFSKKQCQIVHLCTATYLLLWILSLDRELAWKSFVFESDGSYVNPCTMAIMMLSCYYHFIIFLDLTLRKKWIRNVLFIILSVFAVTIINETVCRASLMSFLGFWLFSILKKPIENNYKKILFIVLMISFLFPILYIFLSYSIDNVNFFGKNFFSGRDVVWRSVYENIFDHIFFGAGSGDTIKLGRGSMDDAHNLFLGIWKNVGIIPVVSTFITILSGKNINTISNKNIKAKLMFLTCFIVSTVETVFNGPEYYMFYLTLLITVREEPDRTEDVKGSPPTLEYSHKSTGGKL